MTAERREAIAAPLLMGLGFALFGASFQRILLSLFWPKVAQSLLLLSLFGLGVGALTVFLVAPERRRRLTLLAGWWSVLWGCAALAVLLALGALSGTLWPGKGLTLTSFPLPFLLLLTLPTLFLGAALGSWAEGGEEPRIGWFLTGVGLGLLAPSAAPPVDPPTLALWGIVAGTVPAFVAAGGKGRWARVAAGLLLLAATLGLMKADGPALQFLPAAGGKAGAGAAAEPRPEQLWSSAAHLEFQEQSGDAVLLSLDRRLREDVIAPREGVRFPFPLTTGADGRLDVLVLGFPNGGVMTALLQQPDARFTVLEADAVLVAEVLRRWPALAAASAAGRVRVVGGNPRWFLERERGRFDLIVLTENYSFKAYLSWALNFTRDYRYTVEAFRQFVAHLEPAGILFVQRTGIGRVVSTLREAYGTRPTPFQDTVVVIGQGGKLISQCYFSPLGFSNRLAKERVYGFAEETSSSVLYRPYMLRGRTFYYRLIVGEKVKGYYFSTPLDLSPPTDARPFFDHLERLMISPTGRPLPEELDQVEVGWVLRFIPRGDWSYVAVLLAGFALGGIGIALEFMLGRRRSGSGARVRAPLLTCFFLGAAAALGFNAYGAWAEWLSPVSSLRLWEGALPVAALGLGWLLPERVSRGRGLILLAVLLSALGVGGYRIAPLVPRVGPAAWGAVLVAVGVLLGAATGRSLRVALADLQTRVPGTASWSIGAISFFAAGTWIAGELVAVNFGFPLLWFTAAAAALAALRERRFLPQWPRT
jgi:hypothetical protein